MGKRLPAGSRFPPPTDPCDQPCLVCGEQRAVMTGAFLENPMIAVMVCEPCCAAMVKQSAKGRKATVDYWLLPECARCGAQVPGMAMVAADEGEWSSKEPWREHESSTIMLCHQCVTTLWRQCQRETRTSRARSCPLCGATGTLSQAADGRWGCVACDEWVEEDAGDQHAMHHRL